MKTPAKQALRALFRLFPFLQRRVVLFSGVGLSGVLVQLVVIGLLHHSLQLPFAMAQITSILVAMLSNFALNNVITFRSRRLRGMAWWGGLIRFCLACGLGALFNLLAAQMAFAIGAHWILASLVGTVAGFGFNFISTDRLTWRAPA